MNFLAHCALGSRSDDLLVGSFLGDFLKGPVPRALPADVRAGVRLHRRLDAFSNVEPGIRASVARLPAELRRFAPPFVDLLADHFLARSFAAHHGEELNAFSARAYRAIADQSELLPPPALRFFAFVQDANLFARYREFTAVERALVRMMQRLGRPDAVAPLLAGAHAHYEALERDFAAYYPKLVGHAAAWLSLHDEVVE